MHSVDLIISLRCIIKAYDGVLKRICAEYGLTLLEAKVLSFLHNNPEMNTAGDISEYRMLSKGNVSQAVESLIRRGYMGRTTDGADRRRVRLCLLPASVQIVERIDGEWKKFEERLFSDFSAEEIVYYDRSREKLMRSAREIMGENEENGQ